jgi:hypothetical protein
MLFVFRFSECRKMSREQQHDPIIQPTDNAAQRSKRRRAARLVVAGLIVIGLLVLAEWLTDGAILFMRTG